MSLLCAVLWLRHTANGLTLYSLFNLFPICTANSVTLRQLHHQTKTTHVQVAQPIPLCCDRIIYSMLLDLTTSLTTHAAFHWTREVVITSSRAVKQRSIDVVNSWTRNHERWTRVGFVARAPMLRSIHVVISCSRDHVILVITSSRLAKGTHF